MNVAKSALALIAVGVIAVIGTAASDCEQENIANKPVVTRSPTTTDGRQKLYNDLLTITRAEVAKYPDVCTPEGLDAYLTVLEGMATGGQTALAFSALTDACLEAGLIGEAVGGASVDFSPYYPR
jgi:hypothetical protein